MNEVMDQIGGAREQGPEAWTTAMAAFSERVGAIAVAATLGSEASAIDVVNTIAVAATMAVEDAEAKLKEHVRQRGVVG